MKSLILTAVCILMSFSLVICQTENNCPKCEIIAPNSVVTIGNIGFFEVRGDENFKKLNLSYAWTITNGVIFAGQETAGIFVASYAKEDVEIKVSVKIGGLPIGCDNSISEVGLFIGVPKPLLIDESGRAALPGNARGNLDMYFTQLQNDPSAEGFIVLKAKTKSAVNEQIKKNSSHIFFRGQDSSRFVYRIIISQNDENTTYWIVPNGAEFPSEEGTVNIRASEYANIKAFFTVSPRRKELVASRQSAQMFVSAVDKNISKR